MTIQRGRKGHSIQIIEEVKQKTGVMQQFNKCIVLKRQLFS
jgi:hypothetical protein